MILLVEGVTISVVLAFDVVLTENFGELMIGGCIVLLVSTELSMIDAVFTGHAAPGTAADMG